MGISITISIFLAIIYITKMVELSIKDVIIFLKLH